RNARRGCLRAFDIRPPPRAAAAARTPPSEARAVYPRRFRLTGAMGLVSRLGRGPAAAAAERLLGELFPCPCLGCGAALPWRAGELALCARCEGRLRRPQPASCRCCGRPLPGIAPGSACGTCERSPPPWSELRAAYLYLPPLDAVVRAMKFRRAEFLAVPLGRALAAA